MSLTCVDSRWICSGYCSFSSHSCCCTWNTSSMWSHCFPSVLHILPIFTKFLYFFLKISTSFSKSLYIMTPKHTIITMKSSFNCQHNYLFALEEIKSNYIPQPYYQVINRLGQLKIWGKGGIEYWNDIKYLCRLSAPIQAGPGAHTASSTMGTWSPSCG
jgi:hypothetical protein